MRETIENKAGFKVADTYDKVFEKCVGCEKFPLCIIPLETCTLRRHESFQGQCLVDRSGEHKCL